MQSLAEVVDPEEVASLLTRVEAGQRGTTRSNAGGLFKRMFSGRKSGASHRRFSNVLSKMQRGPWDTQSSPAGSDPAVGDGQDVQSVLARASRREAHADGSELVDLTRAGKSHAKQSVLKSGPRDVEATK